MKLTKAQADLLTQAISGSCYAAPYYRPAIKLVELGLCEWRHGNLRDHLVPTAAGIEAAKAMAPQI